MTEQIIKHRLKSKTYLFGILIMALGFAQQNISMLGTFLGEYQGTINFVIGLTVLILRELTKTPLGDKSDADKI